MNRLARHSLWSFVKVVFLYFFIVVGIFSVVFPSISPVFAQPAYTMNYQGKLTDSTGMAVANGTYQIEFNLYTAPTGGSAIWTETRSGGNEVTVTNGLFSVMLGSVTPLTSVDFDQPLYLGVTVEADAEMTPRKAIGTVPSAFEAQKVGGVASSSFLRSDVADTASGLLSFTGGFISSASSTIAGLTAGTATTTRLVIGTDSVTDLTGANLEVSGGVLRLSSTYIGQSSITTLGTIATGVWQGTVIDASYLDTTVLTASEVSDSAELAGLLSDETGFSSGALAVFSISPTITGTADFVAGDFSSTLTMSGSAANIALGSNFLSGDGDDEGIYVSSAGNVGIGTTTPQYPLHVDGVVQALMQDYGGQVYNVKAYGATGDGSTEDTAAIEAAVLAAYNAGGGTVYFPEGSYVIKRRTTGDQKSGGIKIRPGVSLKGSNATLLLRDNTYFINAKGELDAVASSTITADIAYGTTTITVSDSSVFSVGDDVFLRAGDNEWDSYETSYGVIAKVSAIPSATQVKLDRSINTTMEVSSTETANRKLAVLNSVIRDVSISGFNFINDISNGGNAESGIRMEYAQNVKIDAISAENPGSGLLTVSYSDTINVSNLNITDSIAQSGQSSKGRALNVWNSFNVSIQNIRAEHFENLFLFAESYVRGLRISDAYIVNNNEDNASFRPIFFVGQGSEVFAENVHLTGLGDYVFLNEGGTTGNTLRVHNLHAQTDTEARYLPLDKVEGVLTYNGTTTLATKTFSKTFRLKPSLTAVEIDLPDGWIRSYDLFASATTGITALYLGDTSNGTTLITSSLVSGESVHIISGIGINYAFNSYAPKKLYLYTDGTVPDGAYATININYYQLVADDGADAELQNHYDILRLNDVSLYRNTSNLLSTDNIFSATQIAVGTTTPTADLTVDGTFSLTGGFYDSTGSLGTNGMILKTTGSGVEWISSTLSIGDAISSATQGSVFFAGASGALAQDNANFYWDDSNNRLGIGTTSPGSKLTVAGNIDINANGALYFNGTKYITASTTNSSISFGQNAGRVFGATALYNAAFGKNSQYNNLTGDYNLSLGYDSLYTATSSSYNIAIGSAALRSQTSGSSNVAIGYNSLQGNTTGQLNVGIGRSSLYYNTTGSENTAVGYGTLLNFTTGSRNTFVGSQAGLGQSGLSTGSDNVGVGQLALYALTSGAQNAVVGNNAGLQITSGTYNSLFGHAAGATLETGTLNIAIGSNALGKNVTGSSNVAIGAGLNGSDNGALGKNGAATNTVAIGTGAAYGVGGVYSNQGGVYVGYQAGVSASTGSDYNTFLGFKAGYDVTTGANNIIIGTEQTTGSGLTTGSDNILIGKGVRSGLTVTGSNQLNIGNLLFGTGLGSEGTLSTGNIGIGTSTPSSKLDVYVSNTTTATPVGALRQNSTGDVGLGYYLGAAGASFVTGIDNSDSDSFKISYGSAANAALGANDYFTITTAGAVTIANTLVVTNGLTIDATTETNIESAIDTLANLTSASSLATVGTITSGTWNGTAIGTAYLDSSVILSTEIDTSAELAGVLGDETGTGSVVYSAAPTLSGMVTVSGAVAGATYEGLIVGNTSGTDGTAARLYLSGGGITGTRSAYLEGINVEGGVNTNRHALAFGVSPEGSTPVERMRLDYTGNVGIGDSSPSALLNVGTGNVSTVDGTNDLFVTDDLEVDGDGIFGGILTTTGGLTIDATTETNIESAIDTLANLTSASSLATVGTITSGTWNGTAIGIAYGGLGAAFTDPNADRLMFWDDSLGAITGISTLTGASISGTTLTINDVTCTDCLTSTEIADEYVLNTGDSISGNLTFSGTAANIALGSNFLSGDGDDEGVYVSSTGNVGIGTTTPSAKLEIWGSLKVGTSSSPAFWADTEAHSVYLVPDNTGLVGIGTTSPTHKLTIEDNGGTSLFSIGRNSGQVNTWSHSITGSTAGGVSTNGSYVLSPVTTADVAFSGVGGGVLDNIQFILKGASGNVGIGTTTPSAKLNILGTSEQLRLAYSSTQYWSDTIASDGGRTIAGFGTDADLNFNFSGATDGDFSINTDDLFVDTSTGRVGIGTTNPGAMLELYQASTTAPNLILNNNQYASMGSSAMQVKFRGNVSTRYANLLFTGRGSVGKPDRLSLGLTNNSDVYAEVLTAKYDGAVGIGTTSPSYRLDVQGDGTVYSVAHVSNTANAAGLSLQSYASGAKQWSIYSSASASPYGEGFVIRNITDDIDALKILASGNVGIGTSSPAAKLAVSADSASQYAARLFNDGNNANRYGIHIQAGADDGSGTTYYLDAYDGDGGQVGYIANTSGTFALTDVSDIRTKTNITNTEIVDATAVINALRVVDFNRKQDPDGPRITGFIAQEVQDVYGYAVTEGPNGYLGLMKDAFIPLLVKGSQEQSTEITTLGNKLLETINSVADLEAAVAGSLSESYRVEGGEIGVGELVMLATTSDAAVTKATFGTSVFGVVTEGNGIVLGGTAENTKPIALTGRTQVKVNNEGGDIEIGDAITVSAEAGVGTRATTTTYIIGTALESFDDEEGSILVFIDPQTHFVHNESTALASLFAPIDSDETDTLWNRITTLATNFVDGILAVAGIKTEELCVGEVCVDEAEFLQIIEQANVNASSNDTSTPAPESAPEVPEETTPEVAPEEPAPAEDPTPEPEPQPEPQPEEVPSSEPAV